MPNSIYFYKGISLHVIPVRIIVPWEYIRRPGNWAEKWNNTRNVKLSQFYSYNRLSLLSHVYPYEIEPDGVKIRQRPIFTLGMYQHYPKRWGKYGIVFHVNNGRTTLPEPRPLYTS